MYFYILGVFLLASVFCYLANREISDRKFSPRAKKLYLIGLSILGLAIGLFMSTVIDTISNTPNNETHRTTIYALISAPFAFFTLGLWIGSYWPPKVFKIFTSLLQISAVLSLAIGFFYFFTNFDHTKTARSGYTDLGIIMLLAPLALVWLPIELFRTNKISIQTRVIPILMVFIGLLAVAV